MTTQHLDVYLQDTFVGKLSSNNTVLSFNYDVAYCQKPFSVKLSASLPLEKISFKHKVTYAFFSGLLPDQKVREQLAKILKVSEQNSFAMLKEIGGECAGAISIYPEGMVPDRDQKPEYLILDDDKALDVLSSLDRHPMLAGEEGIRISGAGAQDKLMVAFVDGKISVPKYSTPSTHIIKPAIKGLDQPVQNEFFCLSLAKSIGLPAPKVEIYWVKNTPYYLVERYDRYTDKYNQVKRLHQEDFCQAMHFPPEMKYENEQGPTLAKCFKLIDGRIKSGYMAGNNKITLLQGVIFNFLIGNGDAHGKNFSILYDGESESLAPFYDLMCTILYSDPLREKMAMKLGSKYKFKDVKLRHLEQLSNATGFKPGFINKQIHKIGNSLCEAAPALIQDLNSSEQMASPIYEKILSVIQTNYAQITVKEGI